MNNYETEKVVNAVVEIAQALTRLARAAEQANRNQRESQGR